MGGLLSRFASVTFINTAQMVSPTSPTTTKNLGTGSRNN